MNPVALRGLYAITSAATCRDPVRLADAVGAALRGGARLIQLRAKDVAAPTRAAMARELLALCRTAGACFIVNDDVELAATIGADGVHLGQSDAPLRAARERLGPHALIGVSCANVLPRAIAAERDGASYVAFGRFFPSLTKPDAPPASLELLRESRGAVRLPICAIGGVTSDNAAPLIAAGASMVAAVEGVFGAADVAAAARAYARLFVQ
ncbi:MAG TPA: thiamine phosphate synthase [Verrucomicrobiae bacterium]|nr:thiamine phosphate synthase [Verrucomicrobiae bacterium]